MAGKRQHYIPQFLQKGFAVNSEKDSRKKSVWMHRKGATPVKINTRHVGVENSFYSGSENSQLDDSITAFEQSHSFLLKHQGQISDVEKRPLGELLAHLEIRTRHLRKTFQLSADTLFEEVLKLFDSDELLTQLIHDLIEQDSPIFYGAMKKEFRALGFYFKDFRELGLTKQVLKEGMADCVPLFCQMIRATGKEHALTISSAGKLGQINALNKALAPPSKAKAFGELNFQIKHIDKKAFVLGDAIVLFHVEGKRPFKPFLEKGDCLKSVYLPLSPTAVLIGSQSTTDFDLELLSYEIIASSHEFFIADRPFNDSDQVNLIGQNSHLLTSTQIRNIVWEAFSIIPQDKK